MPSCQVRRDLSDLFLLPPPPSFLPPVLGSEHLCLLDYCCSTEFCYQPLITFELSLATLADLELTLYLSLEFCFISCWDFKLAPPSSLLKKGTARIVASTICLGVCPRLAC